MWFDKKEFKTNRKKEIEDGDDGSVVVTCLHCGTETEMLSVSGVVTEVNVELENSPEGLNHDPYDFGWIFRVEMNAPEELESLMSEEEYEAFLSEEKE